VLGLKKPSTRSPMPLFKKSNYPNPGRLEEIKKEAQSVLAPDFFEGARFEFNKSFGQKFALLHNIALAPGQPGAYEFGANFGDEKMLLASRINMQGALNGRLNATADNWLLRLHAQTSPDGQNSFKADVDYKGGDFSAGGYLIGGGLVGASYLQSVSEGLSLGVEGFYHTLNRKARGGAGALRYVWGDKGAHVATAKVGTFHNGMIELAYQRRVSEKVSLATEMQYYHNQFCQFGLGYEFKLRTGAVFKGLVQSDTTCTAVLEERLGAGGGGIALQLAAQLNHKKKDYKFGVGLSLDGAAMPA